MSLSRAVPAILKSDARRVLRDRFLLGMSAYILGLGLLTRWAVPWVHAEVLSRTDVDITPYVPMGVSYFVLVNASVLTGVVGGFLLLESMEERTMRALLVTPVPMSVHLGLPSFVIFAGAAALAIVEATLVGVGTPDGLGLVVSALLCAPTGVVMALLLISIAKNKVEAFATLKITGLIGVVPIAAFFVPMPWQPLAGVVPPYWACKVWWLAVEGEPWGLYALGGVVVSALWVAVLFRRVQRAVRT